jgi:hypothetical protein
MLRLLEDSFSSWVRMVVKYLLGGHQVRGTTTQLIVKEDTAHN